MLAKLYTKAKREETAVSLGRNIISKSYLTNGATFSDDELLEAVQHVETAYGTFEERPDQFHAVVAAVALQVAQNAGMYGPNLLLQCSVSAGHVPSRAARLTLRRTRIHSSTLRPLRTRWWGESRIVRRS